MSPTMNRDLIRSLSLGLTRIGDFERNSLRSFSLGLSGVMRQSHAVRVLDATTVLPSLSQPTMAGIDFSRLFSPSLGLANFYESNTRGIGSLLGLSGALTEHLGSVRNPLGGLLGMNWQASLAGSINSLVTSLLVDFEESNQRFFALLEKFGPLCVALGWPPSRHLYIDDMATAIDAAATQDDESVKAAFDALMVERHTEAVLEEMFDSWHDRTWIRKRLPIIEEGIKAHHEGRYLLSVPALLPQVEGLIVDGFSRKGWVGNTAVQLLAKRLLQDDGEVPFHSAVSSFYLGTVLRKFEHGDAVPVGVSRHAVLHGGDIAYGTETNSLKTILLIDCLVDAFGVFSPARSHRYHTPGCHYLGRTKAKKRQDWNRFLGKMRIFRSIAEAEAVGLLPCKHCQPDNR